MNQPLDRLEPERKLLRTVFPRVGAIVDYLHERAERSAEELLGAAADHAGIDVDELLRLIAGDERLMVLLASTVEAGQRSADAAKLRALGRVLGDSIGEDADIDQSALMVAALRDLERPHVRALLVIARPGATEPDSFERSVRGFADSAKLKFYGPEYDAHGLMYPIFATLERHGLIYDQPEAMGRRYYASTFGHHLLELLDDQVVD